MTLNKETLHIAPRLTRPQQTQAQFTETGTIHVLLFNIGTVIALGAAMVASLSLVLVLGVYLIASLIADTGPIIGLIFMYPAAIALATIPGARFAARQQKSASENRRIGGMLAALIGNVPAALLIFTLTISGDLSPGARILGTVLVTIPAAMAGGLIGNAVSATGTSPR